MAQLTLGSLFDGSGGFPLAGIYAGIKPLWASEIEPFPIRVTTKRIPEMKHLGDVSKINGAEIEPVDIITFGSPCQDMSVAGKRQGLEGARSNLFYEAIRIIKEMKEKTNGVYPRFIVWENVPGAFSSNKGQDFRAVLEAVCSICREGVYVPQSTKWEHSGEILADDFSVAWRMLDAQYWGVPQRRKRIYLVADFGGQRASKILFESEGVSGYSAESFRAWQRATNSVKKSFGNTNNVKQQTFGITAYESNSMKSDNPYSGIYEATTSRTIDCNGSTPVAHQGGIAIVEQAKSYMETAELSSDNDSVAIAYGIGRDAFNQGKNAQFQPVIEENLQPTIVAKGPGAVQEPQIQSMHLKDTNDINNTREKYTVRRLTPTECARLQGFPDNWCDNLGTDEPTDEEIQFWVNVFTTYKETGLHGKNTKSEKQIRKWLQHPASDTAEYKMWGNGIALPCAAFVLSGIAYFALK